MRSSDAVLREARCTGGLNCTNGLGRLAMYRSLARMAPGRPVLVNTITRLSAEMQGSISVPDVLRSTTGVGVPNGEVQFGRVTTQRSWPPPPPGRSVAKYSVSPSAVRD